LPFTVVGRTAHFNEAARRRSIPLV
jgi:hypothetical protein